MHHRFQLHRIAGLGAGAELPARQRLGGGFIQAGVDAVQHLDAAYGAIGMDYSVERDRALHVVAHSVGRVGGIDL